MASAGPRRRTEAAGATSGEADFGSPRLGPILPIGRSATDNRLAEALHIDVKNRVAVRAFRSSWALPLLVAGLALAVRLHAIGAKPLWYDEVLTLKRAALDWRELAADAFHNKHYPLYFLLTKPFAGETWSESALRLPAALFGALSVLLVARIALDLGGRWAALVAGLLMALSPLEVQYGQEARPYMLGSAAILLATWGVLRLLDQEARHDTASRCGWIAYVLGTTVALNALAGAAASFITINVLMLVLARLRQLPACFSMRTWLGVNLAVLMVWLPSLISLLVANSNAATRGLTWVPPLDLDLARNVLASLYMLQVSDLLTFERLTPPVPLLGPAVVAAAVAGGLVARRRPSGVLLVALALVMPVGAALVSLAKPVFVPRYLLWSTGPYFILAGLGIAAISPVLLRVAASAALGCGAMAALLPYYSAETKPRWDLAASHLAAHATSGDATVVSSGLARLMLVTYLARHRTAPGDILDVHELGEIERAHADGATVWLVHGRAGQGGSLIERQAFVDRWKTVGAARDTVSIGRHITIWRHSRAPPAR